MLFHHRSHILLGVHYEQVLNQYRSHLRPLVHGPGSYDLPPPLALSFLLDHGLFLGPPLGLYNSAFSPGFGPWHVLLAFCSFGVWLMFLPPAAPLGPLLLSCEVGLPVASSRTSSSMCDSGRV